MNWRDYIRMREKERCDIGAELTRDILDILLTSPDMDRAWGAVPQDAQASQIEAISDLLAKHIEEAHIDG